MAPDDTTDARLCDPKYLNQRGHAGRQEAGESGQEARGSLSQAPQAQRIGQVGERARAMLGLEDCASAGPLITPNLDNFLCQSLSDSFLNQSAGNVGRV